MKDKIEKIVVFVITFILATLFAIGFLLVWYVVDDSQYCRKYEKANSNINFEWKFSTGCIFQLSDGTWTNLRVYENRNEYKLELEK